MYKLAARNNCSFKIVHIARWLPDSIVPFFPLKCMGSPEKCTFIQFLSTVHAKVANPNPTNYIFLRSAINTLSIEHIKSPFFSKFKNRAGMPIIDVCPKVEYSGHSIQLVCLIVRNLVDCQNNSTDKIFLAAGTIATS